MNFVFWKRKCLHIPYFLIFCIWPNREFFLKGESAYTFHIFWHFFFWPNLNFVLRREILLIAYFLTFCIWPNHEFCFRERDLTHSIIFFGHFLFDYILNFVVLRRECLQCNTVFLQGWTLYRWRLYVWRHGGLSWQFRWGKLNEIVSLRPRKKIPVFPLIFFKKQKGR